jgi:hypothetical protein
LAADNSTLNISWTNPTIVPSTGIDYEVRTSGAGGSGASGLFFAGNTTANTVAVPGLSIGVNYCVYIKSNCRTAWISAGCVTPICTVVSLPYVQNFEGVIVAANTSNSPAPNNTMVGGYPACNSLVTTSGASMGITNNTIFGYYGFTNKNLITTGPAAQNAWYFTQIINFPSPGSYRLTYKYGGSREQTFFQQKMKVYYGSVASAAGMTNLLADHPNIVTSPETNTVNFTVSNAGNYYIGFNAYSAASNGYLQLDDITVDVATCLPPSGLTSGQLTSNSAVIVWTGASVSPSGYDYYISSTNAPPVATTNPSGSTTAGNVLAQLSSLTPSTTYYFWVRSKCSSTDFSNWTTSPGVFTTSAALVYCSPSGAGFSQDPIGIMNVLMGSINNTTGLEVNNYGDYSNLTTNVALGATVPIAITYGTFFTYDTNIWIDWNNNGDFNDAGELVYSGTSANVTPATLTGSFVVPISASVGQHRLRIGGIDAPNFTGGILAPCRNGQFQAFEDYSIYVIAPPPALSISDGASGTSSAPICSGDSVCGIFLTSNPAAYQVYTWTPNDGTITGNIAMGGVCFTPKTTTTYILTASQITGNFASTSVSYTVYVNPLPTPITISPTAPALCQNDVPLALVATGGIVFSASTTVLDENFNSATNTFTTVNTSVNGSVFNPAWTLHSSPYTYNGVTFRSNDNSQFYMSNSQSQGVTGTTNTQLISPAFSLVGYLDASLSFWHHYAASSSGSASVEVSMDGGTTYSVLPGASWTTVSQGASTAFVNVVLNLSAYVGQTNLKIRFKYSNVQYGSYWSIDNAKVIGSNTSFVNWYPVTGLYNDAASTIPYTGDRRATVYARPTVTTTYVVTSDSPEGCTTSKTVTVSVLPISGGTTSGNQVLTCTLQNVTDITLTGYIGTIVKWQYSASPSFASGVFDITGVSNATSTLTAAVIGQLSATRYYRAVVSNGSCLAYSTISGVIIQTSSTTTETTVVECDSYTWAQNGQTYTISGDYTQVTTNAGGCSATAILHLTIISSAIITQPENTTICSTVGSAASVSVTTAMIAPTFQWQYRVVTTANPNPAWITIDSALSAVYATFNTDTLGITKTSTMPAAGTEYRAIMDGLCGTLVSDTAKIMVVALVKAGTITAASSVCSDDDITFSLTNYSGTSIQWQSAPTATGVFAEIPGAIDPIYTLTNASSSSDKSYRAVVTSTCNNTSATTAIKTITVNPISESGTATGGGMVCSGGSSTLALVGNVGTIQWQYSLDGVTFLNAPTASSIPAGFTAFSTTSTSATAANYLVTSITATIFFRAKVSSGVCSAAYSNLLQCTLGTAATAGTINSAATGAICKGTGTTLNLSGANGVITWEKSTNWSAATPTWTATTNHTTSLATGNLTLSTAYRAKVTIGTCSTVYSNFVTVVLIAAPVAKAITVNTTAPSGATSAAAICTNSTLPKILTEGVGYVGTIQWQSSTTSTTTGFADILGEIGVSYTIANPAIGANYYRVKLINSCGISVYSAVRTLYYKSCTPKMVNREFAVVAYPNPYTENFNMRINTASEETVGISIYDMTGRLIEKREGSAAAVSELQIGTNYPSGVYNIIVTQGSETKALRVIKR